MKNKQLPGKCTKNSSGEYYGPITLKDDLVISKVPLNHLDDEIILIYSGKYTCDILMKLKQK